MHETSPYHTEQNSNRWSATDLTHTCCRFMHDNQVTKKLMQKMQTTVFPFPSSFFFIFSTPFLWETSSSWTLKLWKVLLSTSLSKFVHHHRHSDVMWITKATQHLITFWSYRRVESEQCSARVHLCYISCVFSRIVSANSWNDGAEGCQVWYHTRSIATNRTAIIPSTLFCLLSWHATSFQSLCLC